MSNLKEMAMPRSLTSKDNKISPLEKFYKSLGRRSGIKLTKDTKFDVTSVTIHPIDSIPLKNELRKWCKILKPYMNKSYLDDMASMMWLGYGPVENSEIPKGKCHVNMLSFLITQSE